MPTTDASPMKVGFLIDSISSDRGGTERQLLHTIARLDRTAFEPVLVCLRSTEWMDQNRAAIPCRVHVLGFYGFLDASAVHAVRRLAAIVNREQLRVVQTFFYDSLMVCAAASFLFAQDPELWAWRRDVGLGDEPWYHALFDRLMPVVHRRFRYVMTNSDHVKEFVIRTWRIPASKIHVIHNGVALRDPSQTVPPVMQRWPHDVWIGIVANLRPVKRIDRFVRALARVRDEHRVTNFRAVVLGEGPEEAALRRLVDNEGLTDRVFFEGSADDVWPYLQKLDVGVLCSDGEGLSNSILEYMAAGLPVVATAVGGNRQLVDRSNGFLINPEDEAAFAAALSALIKDAALRQSMGARSFEKLTAHYSWDILMGDLESRLKRLA